MAQDRPATRPRILARCRGRRAPSAREEPPTWEPRVEPYRTDVPIEPSEDDAESLPAERPATAGRSPAPVEICAARHRWRAARPRRWRCESRSSHGWNNWASAPCARRSNTGRATTTTTARRYASTACVRRCKSRWWARCARSICGAPPTRACRSWRPKSPIPPGVMSVTWFNQPYHAQALKPRVGEEIAISGKVELWNGRLHLAPRDVEFPADDEDGTNTRRIVPVYPSSEGIAQRWMRKLISRALTAGVALIPDPLPDELRRQFGLIERRAAVAPVSLPRQHGGAGRGAQSPGPGRVAADPARHAAAEAPVAGRERGPRHSAPTRRCWPRSAPRCPSRSPARSSARWTRSWPTWRGRCR